MTSQSGIEHVVVLVHGTWGRGFLVLFRKSAAAWCQENSRLRTAVGAALGKATEYEVFNWSGANSPGARLRATRHLCRRLLDLRKKFPNAKLHLIAHSHGGNVAFYAASKSEINPLIGSVVCLSTPFIHVKPRLLGLRFGHQLEVLASMAVISSAAYLVWNSLSSRLSSVAIGKSWIDMIVAGIEIIILVSLSWGGLSLIWRKLHAWSHAFAGRMALPERLPVPVLIIRGAADEAASALGAAVLLTSALDRSLRMLLSLVPTFGRSASSHSRISVLRRLLCFSLVALAIGIFLVIASVVGDPSLSMPVFKFVYLSGLIVACLSLGGLALPLIAGTAIVFVWVMKIFAVLPFGPGFAAASLGVQISAEATPPGRWIVVQLSPSSTSLQEEGELRHFTHSNPEALAILHSWLKRRFTRADMPEASQGELGPFHRTSSIRAHEEGAFG